MTSAPPPVERYVPSGHATACWFQPPHVDPAGHAVHVVEVPAHALDAVDVDEKPGEHVQPVHTPCVNTQ